ncbi:hypothetical protein HPB47_019139 [Ixodes persulcatus]|uniref:Uncharacterized protein n=1 Tax=Ixodes persulcatus TaxID=34615 RepID=A0AC60QLJ7_IXOPE|nr:hypothetical protein HPB47_019139 [Ixodes persulcatus]
MSQCRGPIRDTAELPFDDFKSEREYLRCSEEWHKCPAKTTENGRSPPPKPRLVLYFGCLLYRDDFKASSRWLHRFKAMHEIVGKMKTGKIKRPDLSGAWLSLHSDGVVPDGVAPEDFFYGDSCVVATELTDDSIVKDVLGESEDDGSEAEAEDPCEVPSSRETSEMGSAEPVQQLVCSTVHLSWEHRLYQSWSLVVCATGHFSQEHRLVVLQRESLLPLCYPGG